MIGEMSEGVLGQMQKLAEELEALVELKDYPVVLSHLSADIMDAAHDLNDLLVETRTIILRESEKRRANARAESFN